MYRREFNRLYIVWNECFFVQQMSWWSVYFGGGGVGGCVLLCGARLPVLTMDRIRRWPVALPFLGFDLRKPFEFGNNNEIKVTQIRSSLAHLCNGKLGGCLICEFNQSASRWGHACLWESVITLKESWKSRHQCNQNTWNNCVSSPSFIAGLMFDTYTWIFFGVSVPTGDADCVDVVCCCCCWSEFVW